MGLGTDGRPITSYVNSWAEGMQADREGWNGYVCHWRGKRWECRAPTQLAARDKAADHWRVKPGKAYEVTAVLAEKNGAPVTHTPDF